MTAHYEIIPELAHVYLEDSFVLAITEESSSEESSSITFTLDVVLTDEHRLYQPPRDGEKHCYARGLLTFADAQRIVWSSRPGTVFTDANNDRDMGNIDFLTIGTDSFHLGGDWGEVHIHTATEPAMTLEGSGNDTRRAPWSTSSDITLDRTEISPTTPTGEVTRQMSEFEIDDIFPVSFRETPFIVGRVSGNFTTGQKVVLRTRDGMSYPGFLESMHIHRPPSGQYSFVFSEEISAQARPGDVIHSLPADEQD